MHTYLVTYHSVEHGWQAVVAQAVSADGAVRLVVLEYGPPNGASTPRVQQLDYLPAVYVDTERGRRRTGQAQVLVA